MPQTVGHDEQGASQTVCEPCGGSGRLLLAAAKVNPDRLFVGQDIDLRCVRITAINLALRGLCGSVIWGDSLALEQRLAYRTGFNGTGFIREVKPDESLPRTEARPAAELPPAPSEPAGPPLYFLSRPGVSYGWFDGATLDTKAIHVHPMQFLRRRIEARRSLPAAPPARTQREACLSEVLEQAPDVVPTPYAPGDLVPDLPRADPGARFLGPQQHALLGLRGGYLSEPFRL
jgi:hypothetical protein